MITRFEKALEQAAAEGSSLTTDRLAIESHAQKVRRLEELIRAKEANGDRIVIGIGAALVVSAMALPVYASFVRDTYVYQTAVEGGVASRNSLSAERMKFATLPASETAKRESALAGQSEPNGQTTANRQWPSITSLAPYVIHRATEASALIEGPSGLWWVKPGMKIPGAGQILSIEHSSAGWAVITSEITITDAMPGAAAN